MKWWTVNPSTNQKEKEKEEFLRQPTKLQEQQQGPLLLLQVTNNWWDKRLFQVERPPATNESSLLGHSYSTAPPFAFAY